MVRHNSRQLESLIAIAASVAGAHRLEDVLEVAATRAREALGAASMSISRWEVEHGRLRTLINIGDGADDRWPQDEFYPLDEFPAAVGLLRQGRPHLALLDDPATDAAERQLLRETGMASSAAVPIVYEGVTWGELYAASGHGRPVLTRADIHYMEAICGQIGLALGRAELFSRLSALAFEDALTGLANRRAIEDRLEELAARGEPATLLLGDLDGLKAINDAAGHDAGDDVLREAAAALRAAAGDDDLITAARLGGDEFCVLMPGASLDQAEALAARASAGLSDATFSWGVAQTHERDWRPAHLLRAADVAQYEAKRSGGDRVHAAVAPIAPVNLDRRTPRTRDQAARGGRLAESALAWLDGEGVSAPAARRVQAVAELAAEELDAASWSVSAATDDGEDVETIARTDRRVGADVRVVRLGAAYRLADYPRTAAVLARGGAFHVETGDPAADPAEVALLHTLGRTQVLVAGAGGFLVELYGDTGTPPLGWAATALRLLLREAVN